MSAKNQTFTILMGLLSCLAMVLATLILLDLRQQRPMKQPANVSPTPPELDASSPTGTQTTSLETVNYLERMPSESVSGRMEIQDPMADTFASTSGGHPIEQDRTQVSNQKLYNQLSALTHRNRDEEAIEILQKIIAQDPDDLRAYELLGELYDQNDRLAQAITVWQKILEADPFNERVKARLAKAQRERMTHREFTHEVTRHFRIRFEGSENRDLYKTVLDLLEEAYSEVGKALSFYPDKEIIVFLYTEQQFFDVTRAPAWTGGVFDGKIRIPAGGYQDNLDRLRRVLFHEYVHAVVHQMTELGPSRAVKNGDSGVPTWFHEGIAQYLEPDAAQNDVDRRLKKWVKQGAFLELSRLQGSFLAFNNQLAGLAYDESLSAVKFLIDELGLYSLQRLLNALAYQKTIDEAMRNTILISYEEFQSRWEKYLKS